MLNRFYIGPGGVVGGDVPARWIFTSGCLAFACLVLAKMSAIVGSLGWSPARGGLACPSLATLLVPRDIYRRAESLCEVAMGDIGTEAVVRYFAVCGCHFWKRLGRC
jgi:hypothetical protein